MAPTRQQVCAKAGCRLTRLVCCCAEALCTQRECLRWLPCSRHPAQAQTSRTRAIQPGAAGWCSTGTAHVTEACPKNPTACSYSETALQGWQYDEVRPQLQRACSLTAATALAVVALGVALRQAGLNVGLNVELHSGRLYIQWGSPISGSALEPGSVEVSYRGLQLSPVNAAVTIPDQQP